MRALLYILTLVHGVNGLAMLTAPAAWYQLVPGVTDTGPLNPHFVRDIGLGFLAAALSLALAAGASGRPQASLVACAAVFLGGHALLHGIELVVHGGAYLRDAVTILLPGLLPVALLVLSVWKANP